MCSVQGWHTAVKPIFEVVSLERKAVGASVPLPKTIIRYILSAVLPRVLQRKLLGLLPRELGQYLLDVGQGGRLAGDHPLYPLLHPLHISRQQPFCACTTNPLTLCSPPTTRPLSDPLRCDSALLVACVTRRQDGLAPATTFSSAICSQSMHTLLLFSAFWHHHMELCCVS